jgi:hypothetical protein
MTLDVIEREFDQKWIENDDLSGKLKAEFWKHDEGENLPSNKTFNDSGNGVNDYRYYPTRYTYV